MSNMSKTLSAARKHYVPNGKGGSLDCGDEVAETLRPLSLETVCQLADFYTGKPMGYHKARYAHLNNGAVRMNCGNVIRGVERRTS
jgi:hypothetical protein